MIPKSELHLHLAELTWEDIVPETVPFPYGVRKTVLAAGDGTTFPTSTDNCSIIVGVAWLRAPGGKIRLKVVQMESNAQSEPRM